MRSYILLFLFLTSWALSAQQDSLTTLAFGIGVGYYSNTIELTNTVRQEYEVLGVNGIQVGAVVRYFSNKAIGFVGEFNYSQGGWKERAVDNGPAYKRHNDYLELQLLTQVAIGRKLIRPMLQAGPYFAFPIAQRDEVPSGFPDPEGEDYYGDDLPFRPNYGLVAGGGLYIQLARIGIQLEGRYLTGLSDLVRSGSLGVSATRRQAVGGRITVYYEL